MANEEVKVPSKGSKLPKKRVILYSYIGVLTVVTVLFGFHVLKYFYLDPLSTAGHPVYGHRTENLESISESVIASAEEKGAQQPGVSEVKVTVQGPVVYVKVQVDEGVDVETAREAAEVTATQMLDEVGDKLADYSIQLVVSSGDVNELTDANREQELEHYKQHRLEIVEQIVAHAEEYPTQENIERAKSNINVMPKDYNKETGEYEYRYKEEKEAFEARIEALTPLTAEEEEALGDIPYLEVNQEIEPTEISDFPSWGAYDKNTQLFEWQ